MPNNLSIAREPRALHVAWPHYGVGRNTIEAVSGGIEPDEDALTTAKRELREELDIEADNWQHLGVVDPLTGSVVSPAQL